MLLPDLTSAYYYFNNMLHLGRVSSAVFKLKAPITLRPLFSSFRNSITATRSLRHYVSSSMENDLYNYTSGRWM